MNVVHVVVPADVDDVDRVSGGNTYDRRVCAGLSARGWCLREHRVAGSWPGPDASARADLAGVMARIPSGSVVLVDGLLASPAPEVLVPESERLSLVILVHLPVGLAPAGRDDELLRSGECAVLASAARVVTTSDWTRSWLVEHYALPPGRVRVAEPGVDGARLAPGTGPGGELLSVAAVTPGKGHEVLLAALATLQDLTWRCVLVGSLDRDRDFADTVRAQAREHGIGDRVCFAGVRTGRRLEATYAAADLLVLASHVETYGMVATEALARGLPVVATDVGGIREALGHGPDGSLPGLLVPAGDPARLAESLRRWLGDGDLRRRLRRVARGRRGTLTPWSWTVARVSGALAEAAR